MNRISRSGNLLAVLGMFLPSLLIGQPPAAAQMRLASPSNTERVKAFFELLEAANPGVSRGAEMKERAERLSAQARGRDDLARDLITLLEREIVVVKTAAPGALGEPYHSDYYLSVVLTVGALKDRRSVNALVGALHSGNFAEESVAGLGEAAVPRVLQLLKEGDYADKLGAIRALGKLASRNAELAVSAGAMQLMRSSLLATLKDPEYGCRWFAVEALDAFNDAEVRAHIEVLAVSDPATRTHDDGRIDYPVRIAAQKWLLRHPR